MASLWPLGAAAAAGVAVEQIYPPHVLRMLNEHNDLKTRADALATFLTGDIFTTLAKDEREDQCNQHSVMRTYQNILARRLKRAGVEL